MTESILDSIKGSLGLAPDYNPFDAEIMMHINSVFADLSQLGIGPVAGFMISDNSKTWSDYLNDDLQLNNVKSYMHLRVKFMFDGPEARFVIQALLEQIKQFEWRISVQRETTGWTDPLPNKPNDQFVPTLLVEEMYGVEGY